jgi:hypothetical protein
MGGGRRGRDEDGRAERGGLLDHVERDAAREHDRAGRRIDARADQRSGELVERVVASDVLAQEGEAARLPEACGMRRMGAVVEHLRRAERGHGRVDLFGRQAQGRVGDRRHGPQRLLEAVDPAEAAADRAGHGAAAGGEGFGAVPGEPHAGLDARAVLGDLEAFDLVRRRDDPLGDREAEGEVLEILRRGHHHRLRRPVVDERHGRLLGQGAVRLGRACGADAQPRVAAYGGVPGHSAAGRMRRARSACAA